MASGNRIQQLIDAGVGQRTSDFSNDAKQSINSASDEEFNCYLTFRAKIVSDGSQPALGELNKFTMLFF